MKTTRWISSLLGALGLLIQGAWNATRSQEEAPRRRRSFKHWVAIGVVVVLVLALGAFLGAASGIIPITASSGHWRPTAWFLQFSKRRSVATHAIGIAPPSLDQSWMVLKGAGHYETGCRPCHGSPDLPQPRIARALTPAPPYLPPHIAQWKPEELFYIVKHGIKFTGMPAWPTQQRDDEIWAMVAFLSALPRLDAPKYQQLVHGSEVTSGGPAPLPDLVATGTIPRAVLMSCARCHGEDGEGRGSAAFPKLAGQREDYLFAALQAFARDERASGIMQPIAAGLDAVEMRALARHYAGRRAAEPAATTALAASIARGREVVASGLPSQKVPACDDCHGPGPRNPIYPILDGQFADYLALQLQLFKGGKRGGSAYSHIMVRVASGLEPKQMQDVANYFSARRR